MYCTKLTTERTPIFLMFGSRKNCQLRRKSNEVPSSVVLPAVENLQFMTHKTGPKTCFIVFSQAVVILLLQYEILKAILDMLSSSLLLLPLFLTVGGCCTVYGTQE